jgi:hypothetical protein
LAASLSLTDSESVLASSHAAAALASAGALGIAVEEPTLDLDKEIQW